VGKKTGKNPTDRGKLGVKRSVLIDGRGVPLAVLDDITLRVRPAEFVSVLGSSGCGKSTLLRLIAGLDSDYSGEIRVAGERVKDAGKDVRDAVKD